MGDEKTNEEKFLEEVEALRIKYGVEHLTFTRGRTVQVEMDGERCEANPINMAGNGGKELAAAIIGGLQGLLEKAEEAAAEKEAETEAQSTLRRFTGEN